MNTVQRIAKNTTVLALAEVVTAVIGFFFTMYVATYLGAAGFGILSFALALAAIFGVLADFGLRPLTVREVARDLSLAPTYLGNIATMKLALGLAVLGLVALTINLLDYPPETVTVVYLVTLSVVLNAFSLMFYSVFEANERMEFVTIGQVLRSALLLGGAWYVIGRGQGVTTLAGVYLVAGAATLAYSAAVSAMKFTRPALRIDWQFWKRTLGQAWPFALVMIFSTLYYWIDSVMLSLIKGDEVVGWYNAAFRLVLFLLFIPGAYFNAIFPVMSRCFVDSRESLRFAYEKSAKYLLLLAVPIGVGTTLLAEDMITLIFSAEYANSVAALQILIWSVVFIFLSGVIAQLFNSLNRQSVVAGVTGSCALLNVALNLILIPRYSYIGASAATVATELAALLFLLVWSRRAGYGISGRTLLANGTRAAIASGVMAVFIVYTRGQPLWWLVPLSALLYFLALYVMRGIDQDDRRLLRQLISRRRRIAVTVNDDR